MPVRREGRYMVADRQELTEWLGREAHMPGPARIATNAADLDAGLRQSIKAAKEKKK